MWLHWTFKHSIFPMWNCYEGLTLWAEDAWRFWSDDGLSFKWYWVCSLAYVRIVPLTQIFTSTRQTLIYVKDIDPEPTPSCTSILLIITHRTTQSLGNTTHFISAPTSQMDSTPLTKWEQAREFTHTTYGSIRLTANFMVQHDIRYVYHSSHIHPPPQKKVKCKSKSAGTSVCGYQWSVSCPFFCTLTNEPPT